MGKMGMIKEFTKVGFNRLNNATKDLTEEQLDWKSCSEANTIRNVLGHLMGEWYGFIPKILAGDKGLKTEGYSGTEGKSLEQIRNDLAEGQKHLLSELDKVKDEDLAKEMDWFMGKQPRLGYLLMGVSEIIHHEGQIAAIRGLGNRINSE
ncbi:MAG: DinB family protein [Deltaproteobacteria bacterium]|nr:DinB family protein [Deltaproteobacteria bacterium]